MTDFWLLKERKQKKNRKKKKKRKKQHMELVSFFKSILCNKCEVAHC